MKTRIALVADLCSSAWTLTGFFVSLMVSAGAAYSQPVAVEYYYSDWDHYFVTALPSDVATLDGGAFGGVWKRTGEAFNAWSQPGPGLTPTCRFFGVGFGQKSSHFYTPFPAECASTKNDPNWEYESIAFYLQLPDANGTCPATTTALYRLYNGWTPDNATGGAPNHRYTTSRTTFDKMRAAGWTFEGNAATGAFACVPAPGAGTAEGFWRGTTDTGQKVGVMVLDNGTFYLDYADFSNQGLIFGTSSALAGQFTSTDALDYLLIDPNYNPAVSLNRSIVYGPPAITGSYAPRNSLQLTIPDRVPPLYGARTLTASYDVTYEESASLAALAGTYKGVEGSRGFEVNTTMAIDAGGNIQLQEPGGGCVFTGTAAPRGSANVFSLTLTATTTTTGICINGPGSSAHGILWYESATHQLRAYAPYNDVTYFHRSDVLFFIGAKQ